ncbi:putative minor capsid protein [Vibrio phage 242E40-1]|nr:putative minor capsid protein [Vibrio phage 242E40-1]
MPISQVLQDAEIEHALDLVKYGNDRARSLLPFLLQVVEYIEARLAKEGESIQSKKSLNVLLKDVQDKMNSILTKWETKEFQPIIPAVAKQEVLFQASAVNSVVVGYESVIPAIKQVESAAFNNPLLIGSKGGAVDFSKYTKNWKPTEIQRVASRISTGFYAGETTSQIARAVNGLKSRNYADGVMNMSRANIQGMVKTTINHMSVTAKESFNKDNSNLIIGYEIVATLDSKTSAECRYQDGRQYFYRNGRNQPKPSFHINCRSTTSPILSPEYEFTREGRKRPAVTEVDGKTKAEQVSGSTTYYEWLKRQPAAVQDKALGVTQGKVFRNAGLTTEEFKKATVNSLGQPLSLSAMEQNNKKIAEYLAKQ